MEQRFRIFMVIIAVVIGSAIIAFEGLGVELHSATMSHMIILALGVAIFSLFATTHTKRDAFFISTVGLAVLKTAELVHAIDAVSGDNLLGVPSVISVGFPIWAIILIIINEPDKTRWRMVGCFVVEVVTIGFGLSYLSNPWVASLIGLGGIAVMWAVSFLSLRRDKEVAPSEA